MTKLLQYMLNNPGYKKLFANENLTFHVLDKEEKRYLQKN